MPAPAPLFTDDENNPFPSDQITSDPTFFDDYIPSELSRTSPISEQSLSNNTPPTSPMDSSHSPRSTPGKIRSSRNSRPAALSHAIKNNKEGPTYHIARDMSHTTTLQSLSQFKRRKLTSEEVRPTTKAFQEAHHDVANDTSGMIDTPSDAASQRELTAAVAPAETEPDLVVETESQVDTHHREEIAPTAKNNKTEASKMTGVANAAADLPSVPSQTTNQSSDMNSCESMVGCDKPTGTPNIKRRSRRPVPPPTLLQSLKEVRKPKTSARREPSKEPASKATRGLQFSIIESSSHRAYLVKHRNESPSMAGNEWASIKREESFQVQITRHARVRYKLGDIVNISFPKGQGGSAKIIEVRMANVPLIVVQWLYSRSDVSDSGAAVPRLEKWPRDLHMYSDHFQVVSVENIDGRSGATPIDEHYWAATSRRMELLAELEVGL